MKRTLLFVLALIAAGCGPEGKDMAELVEKTVRIEYNGRTIVTSQYLDIETFEPYTGPVFAYDHNSCEGKLEKTAYLENGLHHGEELVYYCDGEIMFFRTYREGSSHGPFVYYSGGGWPGFEAGAVLQKGSYDMGQQCGDWVITGDYTAYPPCPPGLEDGN
jgi:antitoxin component YwqK of YwqJK toxin-antitoxin module